LIDSRYPQEKLHEEAVGYSELPIIGSRDSTEPNEFENINRFNANTIREYARARARASGKNFHDVA